MLQMTPEMEMMMRVVMDVNVIVDWPRADNFTLKQLTAVRKPVLPNKACYQTPFKAVKIYTCNSCVIVILHHTSVSY